MCPFDQYLEYFLGRHAQYPIEHALLVAGGIQQHILDVSNGKDIAYSGAVLTTFGQGPGENDATVPGAGGTARCGEKIGEVGGRWYGVAAIGIAQITN